MGEFAAAQVDSHVSDFMRRVKKDQIARAELIGRHRFAAMDLQGRRARQLDLEEVIENALHETGTVYTVAAGAPHSVRCARPLTHLGAQALLR